MVKFTVALEIGFYNGKCEWVFDNTDDLKNFIEELISNDEKNFNIYVRSRINW